MTSPAPIFVVGAPRSGIDLLVWSLGQHSHLVPLLDCAWIGTFALTLDPLYGRATDARSKSQLAAMGLGSDEFIQHFGKAVSDLITPSTNGHHLSERTRWIAGGTEYAFYIAGLRQMFPAAKFIHILRDVESMVKSVMSLSTQDGSHFTEQSAYEHWLRAVQAAVEAEQAYGSDVVFRVNYDKLINTPDETVRDCLEFLDEPFSLDCLRPLRGMARDQESNGYQLRQDSSARRKAEALSRQLLCAGKDYEPDIDREHELKERFRDRAQRELAEASEWSHLDRIKNVVADLIPKNATVLVVSKGDDELLDCMARQAWHFPRSEDGRYAGFHPASSDWAIDQLRMLREQGANFLLFPAASFWWLDHYSEFGKFLDENYLRVWRDEHCLIYELS